MGKAVRTAANKLKIEKGVEIYAIPIGKKVRDQSMRKVASAAKNVLPLKRFIGLKKLKRKIAILPTKGRNELLIILLLQP